MDVKVRADAEKPVKHRSWLYGFFVGPRKSALLGCSSPILPAD
jgi:hypothetical protein